VIGHGQRSTEDENGRGRGAVVFKQRLRRGAEMMTQRRGEEGFSVVEFLLGVRQGSRVSVDAGEAVEPAAPAGQRE
jgi:hypothetical protein